MAPQKSKQKNVEKAEQISTMSGRKKNKAKLEKLISISRLKFSVKKIFLRLDF